MFEIILSVCICSITTYFVTKARMQEKINDIKENANNVEILCRDLARKVDNDNLMLSKCIDAWSDKIRNI